MKPKTNYNWKFYDPVPGDEPWACINKADFKLLNKAMIELEERRKPQE